LVTRLASEVSERKDASVQSCDLKKLWLARAMEIRSSVVS
jgi:hypothetical protein